jgi:hypothetical protein
MQRRAFVIGAPLALAGCGAQAVWAPDNVVNAAMVAGTGPSSLTLYTMRNTNSGNGAHTALMINASQRVMFDPAGSFKSPSIPERNDVLFGITPAIEDYYVSFHSRETFFVDGQRIVVPPEVAEKALQLAMANGPVAQAACTRATSAILGQLTGFETIRSTFFPNNLRDAVAKLPGVEFTVYSESDSDDKSIAAAQIDAALKAGQ